MIKLQPITHKFTGKDVDDIAISLLPNVEYEIYLYRPKGRTRVIQDYVESLKEGFDEGNLDLAIKILSESLMAIRQDDERHLISGNPDKVNELMVSLDSQSPGFGEPFIKRLAYAVHHQIVMEEEKRLKNFDMPLMESPNGQVTEQSPLAA